MEWGIFPAAPRRKEDEQLLKLAFWLHGGRSGPLDTEETEEEYLGVEVSDCKVAWLQYVGYQALGKRLTATRGPGLRLLP